MTNYTINKGEKCFFCILKWIRCDGFGIFNNMSEYVAFFQFFANVGNVIHAVTIYGA